MHWAVNLTSRHASGQPSRGTGLSKRHLPPPSSSDPGTNSPCACQSVRRGDHMACGTGRMKRKSP